MATKQTAIGLHALALNFDACFHAAVSDDAIIVVFVVQEIAGVIIADDTYSNWIHCHVIVLCRCNVIGVQSGSITGTTRVK